MNIKITKEELLSGDISSIKKVVENFAIDRTLASENENNIVINFSGFTTVDLSMKLQDEKYRTWFKKLDADFPYIPFFLNDKSKTLLFFLLGNIKYSIENNKIIFDEKSRMDYIKEKVRNIRNFCFPHNIDPKYAINRLAFSENSDEPVKKNMKMETYLEKYGSPTKMTKEREIQIMILIKEIPADMKILGVFFVEQESSQPSFTIFLQISGNILEYKSVSFVQPSEIAEHLQSDPSVQICVIFKTNSGYESVPEFETKVEILSAAELAARRNDILQNSDSDFDENQEENQDDYESGSKSNESEEQNIKEQETIPEESEHSDFIEEKVPENETIDQKATRLEQENTRLKQKIRQLEEKIIQQQNIIESYEEEIKKKHSIKNFVDRFFK